MNENLNLNNKIENFEDFKFNKTESIGGNPPSDDQEKLAKMYKETIEQKQVLVRQYTESKAILNDIQSQLNVDNVNELKDRITEREKDVQNLQSRINGLDQASEVTLGQITQESKEKYLKN